MVNLNGATEKAKEIIEMAEYVENIPTEWLLEELVRRGLNNACPGNRGFNYLIKPNEKREIFNDFNSHLLVITWQLSDEAKLLGSGVSGFHTKK